MDSFVYLDAADSAKVQPLYVLHGDEDFLKRQVLKKLKRCVFGPEAGDAPVTIVPGDKATFADVFDELDSVGLFTARRMVIVDNADPFVTKHRSLLEEKVGNLSGSGVLVLDVKTWAGNTRLAKMVPASMTVVCKAPPVYKLAAWCVQWAQSQQEKQLTAPAATHLVDLVGPDMGLLDQEIFKLAIYVGEKSRIDVADVDRLVGHSRAENIWQIFDAIAEGRNADGLAMLGRLFDQGEEPMKLMGAFGSQMRSWPRPHASWPRANGSPSPWRRSASPRSPSRPTKTSCGTWAGAGPRNSTIGSSKSTWACAATAPCRNERRWSECW